MFDWGDQELSNIIWDEEEENRDHIVPYSESQEGSNTHANVSVDRLNSLPDLSASKLDLKQTDEKAQVDDRNGDNFVDYGWANVGSFDDLDRILSNDDMALWSSTKESEQQFIKNSSSTTINHQTESFHDYNMMRNQHSVGPTLPLFYKKHQPVSSSTSYLSDKTRDHPPLKMTPQEKIEKLKRRQKMRALMAVRKQQEEFRQQESQMQFAKAGNVEIDQSVNMFMSLEQSYSDNTRQLVMDKCSLEDTILHKLQNVIEKLGIEIRLCIRDSLFRLAQSALQRQSDGDMEERLSSTKSSATTPDGETKTNPIDRAVAHLLFHTPPDL